MPRYVWSGGCPVDLVCFLSVRVPLLSLDKRIHSSAEVFLWLDCLALLFLFLTGHQIVQLIMAIRLIFDCLPASLSQGLIIFLTVLLQT